MSALTEIANLLDEQDCHSYTLHATDSGFWTERLRESLRLTIIGRSQLEAFCVAIGATPKERVTHIGQRSWWAESDTSRRRLLIEGVSFQHHDDWEPRS